MGGVSRKVGAAAALLVVLMIVATTSQAIPDAPGNLSELTDHAEACRSSAPKPTAPPAEVDETLDDLYEVYEDLPGFIDVYYVPGTSPAYHPAFVEEVPDAAYERDTGVPVAFETVPEAPSAIEPADAQPEQEDVICRGSRPGAWANGCTASFVFRNGSDLYIGSAGHCFQMWENVVVGFHEVGHVVYREDNGIGHDFALIKVWEDREKWVSPGMCNFGGPVTGESGGILGETIVHTGHGREASFPFDRIVPPRGRAGVGVGWGSNSYLFSGAALGGDSGSATATGTGEAVGTLTHGLPGLVWGTRWDKGMQEAEQDLGIDLELVTSQDGLTPAVSGIVGNP